MNKDAVYIPIEVVTDVNTDSLETNLTDSLKNVSEQINKLMSNTVSSAVNRKITTALNTIISKHTQAANAVVKYESMLTKVGKSTDTYKEDTKALNDAMDKYVQLSKQVKDIEKNHPSWKDTNIGRDDIKIIAQYQSQMKHLNDLKQQSATFDEQSTKRIDKINKTLHNLRRRKNPNKDEISSLVSERTNLRQRATEIKNLIATIEQSNAELTTKYPDLVTNPIKLDEDKGEHFEYLQYKTDLQELIKLKQDVNDLETALEHPENYTTAASEQEQEKLNQTLDATKLKLEAVNLAGKNWNKTIEENKYTDDFKKLQTEADRVIKKLEALQTKASVMAATGSTDKQWETLRLKAEEYDNELQKIISDMYISSTADNAFSLMPDNSDVDALNNLISSYTQTRASAMQAVTDMYKENASYNSQTYTPAFVTAANEAQKLQDKLDKLLFRYQEMEATNNDSPTAWIKISMEIERAKNELDVALNKMQELVNAGKAFKVGQSEENDAKLTEKLDSAHESLSNTFSKVKARADEKARSLKKEGEVAKQDGRAVKIATTIHKELAKVMNKLTRVLRKAGSKFNNFTKNILGFNKHGKKAMSGISRFIKYMTRYVLRRVIFNSLRNLISYATKALNTLATQFEEINQPLSALMTSFNTLKGAFVTTFQPLLTTVIPILKNLCDYLTLACEKISSFFAVLVGQDYIYKATSEWQDYADSIDDTTDKLGEYDKLLVINKESTNSNLLDGITYSKGELNEAISDFAEKVKKAWEKADFSGIGSIISEKITSALNGIDWTKITANAEKFSESLATLLNGLFEPSYIPGDIPGDNANKTYSLAEAIGNFIGRAVNLCFENLALFVNTVNWENIANFLIAGFNKFLKTVDWSKVGSTLGNAIKSLLDAVLLIVSDDDTWDEVSKSFLAFASGLDVPGIISRLFSVIVNVVNGLIKVVCTYITSEQATEVFRGVGTSIGEALRDLDWQDIFSSVKGLCSNIVKGLGSMISAAFSMDEENGDRAAVLALLAVGFLKLLPTILNIVSAFKKKNKILKVQTKATQEDTEAVTDMSSAYSTGTVLVGAFAGLVGSTSGILDDATESLNSYATEVSTAGTATQTASSKVSGFKQNLSNVPTVLTEVGNTATDASSDIDTALTNTSSAFEAMTSALAEAVSSCVSEIDNKINSISTTMSKVSSHIQTYIATMVTAMRTGASTMKSYIADFANDALEKINAVKNAMSAVSTTTDSTTTTTTTSKELDYADEKTTSTTTSTTSTATGKTNLPALDNSKQKLDNAAKTIGTAAAAAGAAAAIIGSLLKVLGTGGGMPSTALASGAVLPPNRPFIATVGDQRYGTNVEAPLDTIKQALVEALQTVGMTSGNSGDVVVQLNGREIARAVRSENEKRNRQFTALA